MRPVALLRLAAMGMAVLACASTAAAAEGRKTAAEYAAAAKRLAETYSLDRVAREHVEVRYEDLLGMATPLGYRVPIQSGNHPMVVMVQPDLSIVLGDEGPDTLGLGFALGTPAQLPDMWKITRSLRDGYLPIVESRWNVAGMTVTQTALAILPRAAAAVTGKEMQYVVVRMTVANPGTAPREAPFYVLLGKMGESPNVNYAPFLAPASRWQGPALGIAARAGALALRDRTILIYRTSAPTPTSFHASLDNPPKGADHPAVLTNCLRFDLRLGPGETRAIDLVATNPTNSAEKDEGPGMEATDFDSALRRATADWKGRLTPAMEYLTPEPRLNTIYKQLILSCLGNVLQMPDVPWRLPLQTPVGGGCRGVWAWEFAHMAVPMMGVGYARELRPALRYFTERQNGVGAHSADPSPAAKGAYSGSGAGWTNETGSILWALAEEYRYSRDAVWLKANRPGILAAWKWVQTARAKTRVTDKAGKKVPYYGLLPAGKVGDPGDVCHQFAFNDNLTWYGMSQVAAAFREAGLPEAAQWTREADEYRQCILGVLQREQFVDPETKLLFMPSSAGYRSGLPRDPYWHCDGPVQMFDTGLLPPRDGRFAPMVEYTRRKYGLLMGLSERLPPGLGTGAATEWYPNQTERSFYRTYLGRGEIEKSLLVFYSNLVYGRSSDTYQTSERFHLDDPNFSAFQPNASGNGRMLDMMRRMLIDEQDASEGRLWLLRGCPRRWFAQGQSIAAKRIPTLFGQMSVVMRSDGDVITVDVDCPTWESPKEIRLVLRHPAGKRIATATVNGKETAVDGETICLLAPEGRVRIVCKY